MTVVTGDANANNLTGTAGDDTLIGLGGNDGLYGGDGNDTLEGGTGNDYLSGGAGIDTAYYGASSGGFIIYMDNANFISVKDVGNVSSTGLGTDQLALDIEYIQFSDLTLSIAALNLQLGGAGWGTSYYYGTTAANVQAGTQAKDVMYGGDGNDILNGNAGSAGDDTLYGENGNDTLYGGDGNDYLDGGEGADVLYAGAGNDTINAGRGNDYVSGGDGVDALVYNANSASFIVYREVGGEIVVRDMADTTAAGFGTDRLAPDVEFIQFSDVTLDVAALNLVAGGEGWGKAYFYGTAAANAITGTQAADVMYGGDGNDLLNGSTGSTGNDTLYGENGNDTLNGGDGNDVLDGGADNDTLNGQADNDTLYGGDGNDTLNGGAGNDYLDGGNGIDMAVYANETAGVTVNLGITGAQNTGAGGIDTLINIENLAGSNYNDILTGDAQANRIIGGAGDDSIYGMDGDDTLEGGLGNDSLFGGNGNDTLNGGFGDDYIDGGAGINTISYSQLTGGIGVGLDLRNTAAQNTTGAGVDTVVNVQNIIGSSYADVFIGTDGVNRINGAVGSDTIYGEGGDDYLEGSSGNDTLYGGDGNDTLDGGYNDDYLDGGAGSNYASYASSSAAVTVDLSISGAQYTGAGGGTDTLVNIQNLRGSNFNDTLIGNSSNNVFIGGLGDDYIDGGAGLDSVSYEESATGVVVDLSTGYVSASSQGNDTLISIEGVVGSAFDDTLTGDDNDNIFDGGRGNDTIDGGDGFDIVNYSSSTENLTIDLSKTTAQNFGLQGNDTLLNIEGVYAGSGDDTILGNDDDNMLDGGAGNNTVSYANAAAGVEIDLSLTGPQNTQSSGFDTLVNFNNVTGSAFDDVLTGNAANNIINGGGGYDAVVLSGKWVDYDISYAAGAYTLTDRRGLEGTDTYINIESFQFADQAIDPVVPSDLLNDAPTDIDLIPSTVLVSAPDNAPVSVLTAVDPDTGDTATFTIIGGANASSFYISGNTLYLAPNGISGANPGDMLEIMLRVTDAGGLSYDELMTVEVVSNLLTGTNGNDNLIGTEDSDEINALAGNDIVQGRGGNDLMDGGTGIDTVSYVQASGGVHVDLRITGAQDTISDGFDTITNFENITGSAFDDVLIGDAGVNVINGGDGNDTIAGLGGNDTLIGGLGIDTLDYSEAVSAVTISLRTTAAQNTGGAGTDTVSGFENIIGSAYNDILTQSNGDNVIDGGAGFDRVSYAGVTAGVTVDLSQTGPQNTGAAGIDTLINVEALTGTSYADTLIGNASDNLLQGGSGNDVLDGGAGNDSLDGGAGTDTASYATAAAAVTVNLSVTTAQNTGGAGTDTLTAIEWLTGSSYNDTLIGSAGNNKLDGGAGNDLLDGGAGNDTLIGGSGIDTASYASAASRVTVTLMLTTGQKTTGAGTDILNGIENLIGSSFDDTLEGSLGDNVLIGGAGIDTLTFARHTAGVVVDLSNAGSQNTVSAGFDTYVGFENIIGTKYDDVLTGDAGANSINGGAGNDIIDGGLGNDLLNGSSGIDTVSYQSASSGVNVSLAITAAQNTGGAGTDTLTAFENLYGSNYADTLTGSTAANTLWGGNGNDTLSGGGGNDFLDGGFGADYLDGGTGTDWARYDDDVAGVNVNLATGVGLGGMAQGDTLVNIEYVMGGHGNDTLTGSSGNNRLEGGEGRDTLDGGAGTDILYGGLDNDLLIGGASNDTLNGGDGADVFKFTVGGGVDIIQDFTAGNFGAGLGDALNIADILTGFNPGTSNINDFVRFTTSGSNTIVSIDANGLTGGANFTQVATLQGVTGLSVSALYADGEIIVT